MQDKHWFLISDLFSLLGVLVNGLSVLTMVALALVVADWLDPVAHRRSASGPAPSVRPPLPRSPWASTSTSTSSWRW